MASQFNRADVVANTTRTLLYTAPSNITAIVFSGTVSNTDNVNKADHFITIEIRRPDGTTYRAMFKDFPVAYGGALMIPKVVLMPTESIFVSAETNAVLTVITSIVERS